MKRLNTFITALLLISSLWPTVSVAQGALPPTPYHTVWGRRGAAPGDTGPAQAIPYNVLAPDLAPFFPVTPTSPGIDQNVLNTQISNYAIVLTDCGKTIQAGTGATGQFTVTLPNVSGFPGTCSVLIKNGDTANGKILSGFPSDVPAILYPVQSVGVKIVNGAWQSFYNPVPWSPSSSVTLFVSPSGNDANDGLTAGTPITLATACSIRQSIFLRIASTVTIQLADGTYTTIVNNALCTATGNSGGGAQSAVFITGNCGTPSNVVLSIADGKTGIFLKDSAEASISCLKLQGAGSGVTVGISAAQFSVADLASSVWGSFGSGSVLINLSQSASLNLLGTASMTLNAAPAGSGIVINAASLTNIQANGSTTIAIPSALAWGGAFMQLFGPVMANLTGMTFTGSGVGGTTGKRAALIGNAYLASGGIACNTFFPGNGACTLIQGAQDDAGDPPTTPLPAATTTFGGLPTPVAGMYAYISDGKASNCGDTTCTTFGTAVTGGTGALPLFIWYTGAAWHLVGK